MRLICTIDCASHRIASHRIAQHRRAQAASSLGKLKNLICGLTMLLTFVLNGKVAKDRRAELGIKPE